MDDLIPITVLTGFLGAGKTTLLNRLLRQPELADTAVLINEFGDVGLDHLLVEALHDDVVLLNAGCLCCTVRGDLVRALRTLFLRRVIGPFLQMLITTRGENLLRIKDPLNLAGQDRPLVIHGVQHVFHGPILLAAWPANDDRRSRLVFITRDLDRSIIANGINAFEEAAGPAHAA